MLFQQNLGKFIQLISPQDDIICGPTGRDCIEEAIGHDYNCSVNCEGIYADINWFTSTGVEETKKEEEEWMMLNGKMEKGRESANKMKILALVRDYDAFKKRSVQHFRFDAKETTQSYGKFWISFDDTLFFNKYSYNFMRRRRACEIYPSTGPDLL